MYEYACSFQLHGDGIPLLVYFENNEERFCYVVMHKDISESIPFVGTLSKGIFYDWETPYGYGGPLCDSPITIRSQSLFKRELVEYCVQNGIVTQFVRFHPLFQNQNILPLIIESKCLRETVYIDTTDKDSIMKNMDSKNRNMVRKAIKSGVTISKSSIEDIDRFIEIYNATMNRNCADSYYIFDKAYFRSLEKLKDNSAIFYANFEDKPVAASIIFFNEKYLHYHLSGSISEYMKYSPSNLLLYEIACWASDNKMSYFHLGGGMTANDSLFGFKKQFNKNGYLPFVVGRTIFDKVRYDELLEIRSNINSDFDRNNGFMIQYRR